MLVSLAGIESPDQHAFALCFAGRLSNALSQSRATVDFLPPARIRSPVSVFRARRALRGFLQPRVFDAVICHGIWSHCMFAPAVARSGYAPVLYLHDVPEPRNLYYRWGWRTPPRVCIANSAYTGQLVGAMRPVVPVEVVHPLVNPPRAIAAADVSGLRARLGVTGNDSVILQASRFDPWKGHRNLIHALRDLRHRRGWTCWIAGAPQRPKEEAYKRELHAMVDQCGLSERVNFIGHRDDMEAVLAACDIYCQPNETPEPFGMVFVEALYAGKPIVGTALGGAVEIVSPECGTLCAPAPVPVANALARILDSAELRSQMSKAGPARAAELCSAARFAPRLRHALQVARR